MRIYFLLMTTALSLSACNSKPKTERSLSERLNGETYQSSNAIGSYPVFNNEAPRMRKISGRVFCGEGIQTAPVAKAKVALYEGEKSLIETTTTTDGTFFLLIPARKNQNYSLRAQAPCGSKAQDFKNDGELTELRTDLYLGMSSAI